MDLLEMFRNLSKEEKQEFVNLLIEEINKKEKEVLKTTFSESIHNFLEATGGKPLDVQD